MVRERSDLHRYSVWLLATERQLVPQIKMGQTNARASQIRPSARLPKLIINLIVFPSSGWLFLPNLDQPILEPSNTPSSHIRMEQMNYRIVAKQMQREPARAKASQTYHNLRNFSIIGLSFGVSPDNPSIRNPHVAYLEQMKPSSRRLGQRRAARSRAKRGDRQRAKLNLILSN